MMIPIVISIAVFLVVLGCVGVIWFVFRQKQVVENKEPMRQPTKGMALAFHWSYIILPVAILLLSIILTAYFYGRLPAELAYHFKPDGSPDRWLSREAMILVTLLPQLLFTLTAWGLTWGIIRLSALFRQPERILIPPERILLFMGNMMAMPQIVLCFAMLGIFVYNLYHIQIMPLWVFALIIMVLGGIILGIIANRAMKHVWGATR